MPKVQDILVFFQTSPGLDITPTARSRYEHRSTADGNELGPQPYQTVLSRFCELQEKEEGSY